MTSTKTAADVVRALRVGIDMDDQQETQIMYEGALKDESWVLRAQAVPLIVGCAPADWQQYLLAQDIVPQEEILWHALANDLGVAENAEIEIGRLVEWARVQSIPLHLRVNLNVLDQIH